MWDARLIGLFLVTILGVFNFLTEVGMEFIEVYGEVPGSVRSDINFGSNSDVRVITLIGKKWGNTSRGIQRVVVGKFGKWEDLVPVILLVGSINPNVLL